MIMALHLTSLAASTVIGVAGLLILIYWDKSSARRGS
jgi:hypothetical protein